MLKAREPARILIAIGGKDNDSAHLEYKRLDQAIQLLLIAGENRVQEIFNFSLADLAPHPQ